MKPQAGTALVVGGTGGIGRSVCHRLAQEWEYVAVGYRSRADEAATIAWEIGSAFAVRIDLRKPRSIASALSCAAGKRASVRAVVVASGAAIGQPYVADIDAGTWSEVLQIELLGFTNLIASMLPALRERGGGSLVAVTSFANVHFPPGDALSSVPKAGIEALCRALAKEEGRNGIRANCVAPAMVNAGLGERYQREILNSETWGRIKARIPLRRFAEAEEIAEAVAFLLSDRASFITGQTLVVDGGQSL